MATNANGCVDTGYVQIYLDGPAGLNESDDKSLNVYSSENNLIIKYPGNLSQKMIKIYDFGGKTLFFERFSSEFEQFSWNFGKGVFIYECIDSESGEIEKKGKIVF